jgi:uncharacterized protein YpmB
MSLLEQGHTQAIESILRKESQARGIERDDLVMRLWLGQEFQTVFQQLLDEGVSEDTIKEHLQLERDMEFIF